jgi:RNA polymerase sigma factor (sigma-70 family)
MLRARGGDREAFAALYDRWAGPLRRWLLVARFARPEDADDLVQAAFLRVWRAAGTYEVRARFSTFLFQVAENHLRNERDLRWNRSRPASLDAPGGAGDDSPSLAESLPGDDACPGRDAAEREEHARLRAAVARLPDHLREVVVLGAVEGRPYADVAATLGIPVGTVKRRMFDAVRLLRQRLGAREDGKR